MAQCQSVLLRHWSWGKEETHALAWRDPEGLRFRGEGQGTALGLTILLQSLGGVGGGEVEENRGNGARVVRAQTVTELDLVTQCPESPLVVQTRVTGCDRAHPRKGGLKHGAVGGSSTIGLSQIHPDPGSSGAARARTGDTGSLPGSLPLPAGPLPPSWPDCTPQSGLTGHLLFLHLALNPWFSLPPWMGWGPCRNPLSPLSLLERLPSFPSSPRPSPAWLVTRIPYELVKHPHDQACPGRC